MHKSGLVELEAVVAVARRGNFRAASLELGMSSSALSRAVAGLEARLGVRLFNRTTRSVSLSEAGEQFVAQVAPALTDIQAAMETVNSHRDTPRDAAPEHLGRRGAANPDADRAGVSAALPGHDRRHRHRRSSGRHRRRRLRCRHPAGRDGAAGHDRGAVRAAVALRRRRHPGLFRRPDAAAGARRPDGAQLHPHPDAERHAVSLGVRTGGRDAGRRRARADHPRRDRR